MPMTSALRPVYCERPAVMSHNSWVQTPVKARGTNNKTVFLEPKLALSFTSTRPVEVLDLRVKSGAADPTAIGIVCTNLTVLNQRLPRSPKPTWSTCQTPRCGELFLVTSVCPSGSRSFSPTLIPQQLPDSPHQNRLHFGCHVRGPGLCLVPSFGVGYRGSDVVGAVVSVGGHGDK